MPPPFRPPEVAALPSAWRSSLPRAAGPYRPWLAATGSLSARIASHCGELRVRRVFQGLRRPHHDEATLVRVPVQRLAHVREVVLVADGTPVVFAHSVVAAGDLHGAWRSVGRLGERPLASALFADPRVTRGALAYRRLDARHPLYARAATLGLELAAELWARRSSFQRNGRPLLVTEVFLPSLTTRALRG
jgi:chorismate lyase